MVHDGLMLIDTNGLRRDPDPDPFGMVHDGLMLIRLAIGLRHGSRWFDADPLSHWLKAWFTVV